MPTRTRRTTRRTTSVPTPTPEDMFASVRAKFRQLSEIRAQINRLKPLYAQHDALLSELLPLFVTKTDTQFIIRREITLGDERHTLVPYFYDERKGTFLAKQWKSTAMETMRIEG